MEKILLYSLFLLLSQQQMAAGNQINFEWALQIYEDGEESLRLKNSCSTYYKQNCGNTLAQLHAPSASIPNKIIGEKLGGGGNEGLKLHNNAIFYDGYIPHYYFGIAFKINNYGSGDIFVHKAAENLQLGNIWCKDLTHKLWVSYYTKSTGKVEYETDYRCLLGKWTNLLYKIINDQSDHILDISVRTIDDAEGIIHQELDGGREELTLNGSVDEIIEIGHNLDGYIHSFHISVGVAPATWKLTTPLTFQSCQSHQKACQHKNACVGLFTLNYTTNLCILDANVYDYCIEFESLIGCKACKFPSELEGTACVCGLTETGISPHKICGCPEGEWLESSSKTCKSCGWSCLSCNSGLTCEICKDEIGVSKTTPCGCDSDRGFSEIPGSNQCTCEEGYLVINHTCMKYNLEVLSHKAKTITRAGEDEKIEIGIIPEYLGEYIINIEGAITANYTNIRTLQLPTSKLEPLKPHNIIITSNISSAPITLSLTPLSQVKLKTPIPWQQVEISTDLLIELEYFPPLPTPIPIFSIHLIWKNEIGEIIYETDILNSLTFNISAEYITRQQNYELNLNISRAINPFHIIYITSKREIIEEELFTLNIITSNKLGKYSGYESHQFMCNIREDINNYKVRYRWNIYPNIQYTENKKYMEIKGNSLEEGRVYKIECKVYEKGVMRGRNYKLIESAEGLEAGEVNIYPNNTSIITGFQTVTQIRAIGFGGVGEVEFEYIVGAYGESAQYIIHPWTTSRSISTTLINGILEYNYRIWVAVYSRHIIYHQLVSAFTTIISIPSHNSFSQQMISIINNIPQSNRLFQLSTATSLITLINIDNKEEDECGGCNIEHGYCDDLTSKCICEEGYNSSHDCSLSEHNSTELLNTTALFSAALNDTLHNQLSAPHTQNSTLWEDIDVRDTILDTIGRITQLNLHISLPTANYLVSPIIKDYIQYCHTNTGSYRDFPYNLYTTTQSDLKVFNIIDNLGIGNRMGRTGPGTNSSQGLELTGMLKALGVCRTAQFSMDGNNELEIVEGRSYSWEGGRIPTQHLNSKRIFLDQYELRFPPNYSPTPNLTEDNEVEPQMHQITIVNWKFNPLSNFRHSEGQLANTIEISLYEGFQPAQAPLANPIYLNFPFYASPTKIISDNIHCAFFNESEQKYSGIGVETERIEYDSTTGRGFINCKLFHLSLFTAGYWGTVGNEFGYIIAQNNLIKVPTTHQAMNYNPMKSFAFYVGIVVITLIIICWWVYRYKENKIFEVESERENTKEIDKEVNFNEEKFNENKKDIKTLEYGRSKSLKQKPTIIENRVHLQTDGRLDYADDINKKRLNLNLNPLESKRQSLNAPWPRDMCSRCSFLSISSIHSFNHGDIFDSARILNPNNPDNSNRGPFDPFGPHEKSMFTSEVDASDDSGYNQDSLRYPADISIKIDTKLPQEHSNNNTLEEAKEATIKSKESNKKIIKIEERFSKDEQKERKEMNKDLSIISDKEEDNYEFHKSVTIKKLPVKAHHKYCTIFMSVHSWFSPFLERQIFYRRSDRILILGVIVLLTLWSTGIFWDNDKEKPMQASMSTMTLIFISLICICVSIAVETILTKFLCCIGANIREVEKGHIDPKHIVKRRIGFLLIFILLFCSFAHINIMAMILQEEATTKWMKTWLILIGEILFLLQPLKALLICLIYSPNLCASPIALFTGVAFRNTH